MPLTPLAAEILTDLADQFPDGASLRMLRDWLGEDIPALKGAVAELRAGRLAHTYGTRLFHGQRPGRGDTRRDAVRARRAA